MIFLTQAKYGQAILAMSAALIFLQMPMIGTLHAASPPKPLKTPNILFFILDDIGIDQMEIFGYGGLTAPKTPNINAVARAGVRFRNTWAMPECSPSRAMFFQGRYPLRTNVFSAILALDLANSQVSPFETTTPRILKRKNYDSGLFGKFHLSGMANNPFGNGVAHALGWDFFAGFLEGAPFPIDTTAGGVGAVDPNTGQGPYGCGFVPNSDDDSQNGANGGACYSAAGGSCTEISRSPDLSTPGRVCLEQGGIFVPNQACQGTPPANVSFTTQNAYYVGELVINREDGSVETVPLTDPQARTYRSSLESDLAIQWIQRRPAKKPWMATMSYSSAHTPYQQPPVALLPAASVDTNGFNCTDEMQLRILSNQMIEAIDKEIGRVMVETGLATYNPDGRLNYQPDTTDTMVVIIGDNGTFAPGVKAPFDSGNSKGTVYQTGVWVPLIAAGPLVQSPDRDVTHMVNVADLFTLFGEMAGVDVYKVVPKPHVLDAVSMLPYLSNPDQESLRTTNFTQTGINITANGERPSPCVISLTTPPTCLQLFPQRKLCEFEGGTWYGPGNPDFPDGLSSCCEVNSQTGNNYSILPDAQQAVRNDRFKLVQKEIPNCATGKDDLVTEFYQINEDANLPRIDRPAGLLANNLLTSPMLPPQGLNAEQLVNFNDLYAELQSVLNSEIPCSGDGNLDKKVNGKDIQDWKFFRDLSGGKSSWYDLNLDGLTDELDLAIIKQHLGTNCLKQKNTQ